MAKRTHRRQKMREQAATAFGEEPKFSGPATEGEVADAENWYSQTLSHKNAQKALVDHLRKNGRSADADAVAAAKIWQVGPGVCYLARMVNRGLELSLTQREKFEEGIAAAHSAVAEAAAEKARADAEKAKNKIAVDPDAPFRAEIDEILDLAFEKPNEDFRARLDLAKRTRRPSVKAVASAAETVKAVFDEVSESLGSKDPEVRGWYSAYSNADLRKIVKLLGELHGELQVTSTARRQRIKRAPKKRSAEQLTRGLRTLTEDAQTGLRSQPKEGVLGASEVWVYDAKHRIIKKYTSDAGIGAKGVSLTFESSVARKVRDPKTFFGEMRGITPIALNRAYQKLTTREFSPTGRTTEDTIILSAK